MQSSGFDRRAIALGLGLVLVGCETYKPNEGMPLQFTSAERPAAASGFPNWPNDPRIIEERAHGQLESGKEKVLELERTEAGTTGALSIVLSLPDVERDVRVKWKVMPRGTLDDFNNSARKQIAAYQLQKLFLDPEDYVVPTVLAHCVPLPKYRRVVGGGRASLDGVNCVLGLASVWMLNVTGDTFLYEEGRFVAEPVYAYYMSNFNLFTYLVDYSDPKPSNFLVSKEPERRQVFSIDNDLAFGEFFRNAFPPQWNVIFVPALRQESIARLRTLRREDLDGLGVVAQHKKDRYGVLRAAPPGENLAPNKGVRVSGDVVQLGLTRAEINGTWKRIQALLARIEGGEIPLF